MFYLLSAYILQSVVAFYLLQKGIRYTQDILYGDIPWMIGFSLIPIFALLFGFAILIENQENKIKLSKVKKEPKIWLKKY